MCIGVALASLAIYDASERTLSSTRVGQCVLMGILGGVLLAGMFSHLSLGDLFIYFLKELFFECSIKNFWL